MYDVVYLFLSISAVIFAYLGGHSAGKRKGIVEGAERYRQYIIQESRKILGRAKTNDDISEQDPL